MTEYVFNLIRRYQAKGILVDTNILLLLFVGNFNRDQIPRFKRTSHFTIEDYDLLIRLLSMFRKRISTPNILSEVNSLSGPLPESVREEYSLEFARGIETMDEHYLESKQISKMDEFQRLGLTDSGILYLVKNRFLVLTDDFKLVHFFLEYAGIDVLNFNHLRLLGWN